VSSLGYRFIVSSVIQKLSNVALFMGLILSYIMIELAYNSLMIYVSLVSFSLLLSIILLQSCKYKSYIRLLATFISIYLVNSIFCAIIDPQHILTWDHKAMANLAEYIVANGVIPRPEQAFTIGSRIEYASYPAPFILWAISSMVLGTSAEDLMVSPSLILPLILILSYALHSLLPRNSERERHRGGILYVLFGAGTVSSILFFNQLRFYFIYQNFARYILFLYSSLLFIDVVRKERKISTIALILMSTLIIFSHSESSIALVLFAVGLLMSLIVSRRSAEARKHVTLLLTAIIISLGIYYLWAITTFTKSLFAMLRQMLEFLVTEEAGAGLRKYTPYDYTFIDLVLMVLSALAVVLVSLNALVRALFLHRRMPLMLIPLLISGSSMVLLFAFTPYKSDISLKFIYITAVCIAMFFVEVRELGVETGLRFKSDTVLALVLAALLIMGIMVLEGYTKEPIISYQIDQYNVLHQLSSVVYPLISGTLKEHDIHVYIIDSPLMPYYYIRDFLVPRGLSTYVTCYLYRDEWQYNILQKNGIFTPRFSMITSRSEHCLVCRPLYGFVSSYDLVEVEAGYSVILSTSRLGIFYAG